MDSAENEASDNLKEGGGRGQEACVISPSAPSPGHLHGSMLLILELWKKLCKHFTTHKALNHSPEGNTMFLSLNGLS